MPVYEYKGMFYELNETDPAAAKAKIVSSLDKQYTEKTSRTLDFLPKGVPEWMQSKPGQGWDDANAPVAGGDPTNPMAYLSSEQKTEQGPAMQSVGQGVNRALQVGAGVAKGAVINPVAALAQTVGGETGREFAKTAQDAYKTQRTNAGGEGFDWAELIGATVSPANRLLPGGGYTGGAIGAAMQPLEGEYTSTFDVLTDKAKQMAGGAILGKVAENLIGAITPKLKEGARELIDSGVPITPGQAYEGAPGWLFRQIESFGLGPNTSKVNKAFNTVVADDVLSSIGGSVPPTIKPGQMTADYVRSKISKYYDTALESLGKNPFDLEYKQGTGNAIKEATANLANPAERDFVQKKLINSLEVNIGNKIDKDGNVSGENLKLIKRWVEGEIDKVKDKTGAVPEALTSGYGDILANLNQYVNRIDKDGTIAAADKAWAKLYSFADASKKAVTKEGVFNPEQLAQSAAEQAKTLLQAGSGKGALNEQAQKALTVIGKQEPASLLKGIMIASKAATGVATYYMMPQIAIPVLVASGVTYTAAKQLMKNPSAARLALKKALENNSGAFGAAGSDLYNQIIRDETQTP